MNRQIPWSPEQREALDRAIAGFKTYALTDNYKKDLREREERKRFFQKVLPERLERLSEADVEEIVGLLWAHRMWGNKVYVVQTLVKENGLDGLSKHLRVLYDSRDDPEEGYERFLSSVKGWGPAAVTEMLAYIYPERCGLWNKQARDALTLLKLDDRVPVKKYQLSKDEYRRFNALLRDIAQELRRAGFQDVDLLITDFFLYYVATAERGAPAPVELPATTDFDHDEIRDIIANMGSILGFDTETEANIARGAKVDVVWRARIGNLGMVTYVFEVHRRGSIDSLILNLQKALSVPSVQKVIAVSDREQLQRIEKECEGLPEQFRHALRLWDVAEVIRASEALQQAMSVITKLGLLEEKER